MLTAEENFDTYFTDAVDSLVDGSVRAVHKAMACVIATVGLDFMTVMMSRKSPMRYYDLGGWSRSILTIP